MIMYVLKYGFDFDFKSEGFTTNIQMTTCPPNSVGYVTSAGDTNCCDGDIVNNKCNGKNICSLSPKPPNGIMNCSEWMNKEWTRRSSAYCPSSMPNYFGPVKRGKGLEGCSEVSTNLDGSGPSSEGTRTCKIYSSEDQDLKNIDSCFNQKALEDMKAPGTHSIINTGRVPLLISTGVSDGSSPVPTVCYDYKRAIQYLQDINSQVADALRKDPCIYGDHAKMCGMTCLKDMNPTGYVISGRDIEGEIPVQAIFKGDKTNPDEYIYWAQNKDRIMYKNTWYNVSFNGQLSKINWSDKSIKDNSDLELYEKYANSLDISTKNLKQGDYKVRKL